MQEDLEQRTISVSIQAAKLSGRVLRAAIAAVLQKMEQERTMPKVGRNSMKRLTYKDPGANTIEVSGRIRSFERYARKHQVRYHIEKELGTMAELNIFSVEIEPVRLFSIEFIAQNGAVQSLMMGGMYP